MKENPIKTFVRETYQTGSPIPYIISAMVFMFVLIHLFDLLVFSELVHSPICDNAVRLLSLPNSFGQYLNQPWAILTYPLIYRGLFNFLFDCLWLYWMGNMFLLFLNKRQFLFVYFGALLIGGCLYLAIGQIPFLSRSPQNLLNTSALGLGALIGSMIILIPNYVIQLAIIGKVRLKTIGFIYIILEFGFYALTNRAAALCYCLMVLSGMYYMYALKNGKDWSRLLIKKQKTRTRVFQNHSESRKSLSNNVDERIDQEVIDQLLDKISAKGYESLTTAEKHQLFKASKQKEK